MVNFKRARAKSAKVLKRHSVPMHPHIPLLDNTGSRSGQEVARRLVALYCLAGLANGACGELLISWLTEEQALPFLLEEEKALLCASELSEEQLTELSWKVEPLYVLCWYGGLLKSLPWPDQVGDLSPVFSKIPPEVDLPMFIKSFSTRRYSQLVSEVDLYYCLHSSVKHPELWNGKDPADRVRWEVISERRYALEWLFDSDIDWADVSLDT